MKASDLRGLMDAELTKRLDDAYEEMFNLRFQRAAGKLPNPNRLKEVRRDIARLKTVMRERELLAEEAQWRDEVVEAELS